MSAADIIADVDAAIAEAGQTVILRKTNTAEGQVTVRAKVRYYRPNEITGIIQQGDSEIILSPTDLGDFGLPSQNGFVVVNGAPRRIIAVTPEMPDDTVVKIALQVRG